MYIKTNFVASTHTLVHTYLANFLLVAGIPHNIVVELQHLKEKTEDFEKLYQEHKELEKKYDWQRDKLKEALTEVKEKTEASAMQE